MERRLRGRNPNRKYDFLYIGIGLVISIMAIFALTKPEENQVLFPFIFFLALFLCDYSSSLDHQQPNVDSTSHQKLG